MSFVVTDPFDQTGIYLHIPFCRTKCLYCSFNSYAGREDEIYAYLQALEQQIKRMAAHPWSQGRTFFSLYIGGGTPTICNPRLLGKLIVKCLAAFPFCVDPEITVESNPNTLSSVQLQTLLESGVNRLSIGVQSFASQELKLLGRSHTSKEACQAFFMARNAGFTNINLDLMYGLPRQTVNTWRQSLETAVELAPEHLSLYELMVEDGTPLASLVKNKECVLPHEDLVADMENITAEILQKNGYCRYEISNYARPGSICRHNINYWQNGSWLGFGAGAVGSLSGMKVTNIHDSRIYTKRINCRLEPFSEIECLSRQAHFRETVIMGLRMLQGISLEEMENRFRINPVLYYGRTLQKLIDRKLLVLENGFMRLSDSALPLANQVLLQLV